MWKILFSFFSLGMVLPDNAGMIGSSLGEAQDRQQSAAKEPGQGGPLNIGQSCAQTTEPVACDPSRSVDSRTFRSLPAVPRVLLIFPAGGFSTKEPLPPLGLAFLAAVLERDNIPVTIIDAAVEHLSPAALARRISDYRPDLIGITVLTEFRFSSFDTARVAREAAPEALVLLGGPHVTLAAEDTAKHVLEADLVVRGEAEEIILQLIRTLSSGGDLHAVPGLTWREGDRVVSTPNAPLVRDLDSLPFPARHLLPMTKYRFLLDVPGLGPRPAAHTITSRGCPFGCSFCATSTMMGMRWRARSAANVLAEVKQVVEEGADTLWFYDDTFTMNKKRVEDICRGIIDLGLNIHFTCSIRVDTVDRELLALMQRAGCFMVFFGVESGNQETIDRVCGKRISLQQVRDVARWCDELGIRKNPGYIVGFPGETLEQARQTLDFMQEVGGKSSLSFLRIYPGTAIEHIAREKGILGPEFSWADPTMKGSTSVGAAHGTSPLFLDTLSWEDMSRLSVEWAAREKIPLWKKIPKALRSVRSLHELRMLSVTGRAYLRSLLDWRQR